MTLGDGIGSPQDPDPKEIHSTGIGIPHTLTCYGTAGYNVSCVVPCCMQGAGNVRYNTPSVCATSETSRCPRVVDIPNTGQPQDVSRRVGHVLHSHITVVRCEQGIPGTLWIHGICEYSRYVAEHQEQYCFLLYAYSGWYTSRVVTRHVIHGWSSRL
jgi:hypothetical protein